MPFFYFQGNTSLMRNAKDFFPFALWERGE
jgi:hypothetical protein